MYYRVISQCVQMLKNLESWLDKAEEHAVAKKFDVGVLMAGRLAPDMKPFIYQVQSACDYVKAAAAWLSGQMPPKHEDNEQTIDELRARIRKTVAFAKSVKEAQYARHIMTKWPHHPNLRKKPHAPSKGRGPVQRAIRRAFMASGAEVLNSTEIYDWAHGRR